MLLRHTRPAIEDGVCYGRMDLDIAETFEDEASTIMNQLPPIDAVVSSPLQRCLKLACRIGVVRGLHVIADERIIEMDFGKWEGQNWADIPKLELEQWSKDFLHARPHGGESVAMLRERTLDALKDRERSDASILVVTHAGVIKSAVSDGDDADAFNMSIGFGEMLTLG